MTGCVEIIAACLVRGVGGALVACVRTGVYERERGIEKGEGGKEGRGVNATAFSSKMPPKNTTNSYHIFTRA
jgi:hypothetical protein